MISQISKTNLRKIPVARLPYIVTVRLQSTKDNNSSNITSSTVSNTQDEIDSVLLDKLFNRYKPTSKDSYLSATSFRIRSEYNNLQQKEKFNKLDSSLLKLRSTPINFNYYLRNLKQLKNANQLPYKFGSNQIISNNAEMDNFLKEILWEFNAPIRYSFGYGSKVFNQGSQIDVANSQIDMIFAVSYPDHWHSLNINQFPKHYSSLRHLGSNAVSKIGNLGAGVYFNPFVSMTSNKGEQFQLKYGVTSMNSLIHDLMNWETMYLSGRLHKPVAIIRNSPNISLLNQYNLVNAIKLSILLLNKPEIREFELYHQIASLSYTGDPRLKVRGEDPNKVNNIVSNQFDKFREMYLPLLTNYFPTLIQLQTPPDAEEHVFKINTSTEAKSLILVDLPKSFRKKLLSKYTTKYASEYQNDIISQHIVNPSLETQEKLLSGKDMSFADLQAFSTELTNSSTTTKTKLSEINRKDWEYLSNIAKIHSNEFIAKVSNDEQLVDTLKACVTETVKWPALVQSLKGVSTAGLGRSWKYALEKRKKYDAGIGKN